MTDAELATIEQRLQANRAAPWQASHEVAIMFSACCDDITALVTEVRRLTALTKAVDLLQAENAALLAQVAKMAPLYTGLLQEWP